VVHPPGPGREGRLEQVGAVGRQQEHHVGVLGKADRLAIDAGFTRFRRAAETPFNIVLEARP
jgi:hypothetical protein